MQRWSMYWGLVLLFMVTMTGAAQAQQAWNSVTLTWTTPGDDSLSGTASQFDIRYSTSLITPANFGSATRWTSGVPAPSVPGTSQSVMITGLQPTTTYYFAIKTGDEVPNWANVSNVVTKTTAVAPDVVRPAALAISSTASNDTSVTLSWVATGDDSLTGTGTTYDVRYSTSPINSTNWASATQVTGEPSPSVAGTTQTYKVNGLSRQTQYYFAAKLSDEAGNTSALSNVLTVTTPDTKAPAAITDLVVGYLGLDLSSVAWMSRRSGGR